MADVVRRLARLRVPLGFASAALAFLLARPSTTSLLVGLALAVPGELLRLWAAGHIHKGREITQSGPYRFLRHPLYTGSALMGIGFAVASRSVTVLVLAVVYLGLTLFAAIRSEEATLDARFDGAYAAWKQQGTTGAVQRPFQWSQVKANREYRAVAGVILAFGWLLLRAQ